jgi:hypothetical protein
VTHTSSLRRDEADLQRPGGDIVSVIVRALSYITADSNISQQGELERLLRSSLSQSGCIDPSMFADYAHIFLSGLFPAPTRRSVFGLTPRTGTIIDLENLVSGELIGPYAKVFQCQLMQGSCARTVTVKKVTPSLQNGEEVSDTDESIQLCVKFLLDSIANIRRF